MASAAVPAAPVGHHNYEYSFVNATDPLAELRDIHLPDSVSAWPLAPGWWLLIFVACAGLTALLIAYTRRRRARLYRRQALLQLQQIEQHADNQMAALLELLKQTVNSAYPNQRYSSLTINAFFTFLQQSCPAAPFANLPANLESLLYAKDIEQDPLVIEQLYLDAKTWIRHHVPSHKLDYQSLC
ncbi:MAG: DUF4381 domain-containing protein [Porticoccaceae bacterium]